MSEFVGAYVWEAVEFCDVERTVALKEEDMELELEMIEEIVEMEDVEEMEVEVEDGVG
jgi:hypothetical protein